MGPSSTLRICPMQVQAKGTTKDRAMQDAPSQVTVLPIQLNVLQAPLDLYEHRENLRSFLASNPAHRVASFLIACRNARMNGLQDFDLQDDSSVSQEHPDDCDSS